MASPSGAIISSAGTVIGPGGAAPANAEYLVLAASALLTDERVFTPSTGLTAVDGGAGGAYTLSLDTTVAWIQGGNSFGVDGVLGTNDAFDLVFETDGIERVRVFSTAAGAGSVRLDAAAAPANQTLRWSRATIQFAQMGLEGAVAQNVPGSAVNDLVIRLAGVTNSFFVTAGATRANLKISQTRSEIRSTTSGTLAIQATDPAQANSSIRFMNKTVSDRFAFGYGESGGLVTGGDAAGYSGIVHFADMPLHFSLDGTQNRNWYTRVVSGVPLIGTQQSAAFGFETAATERARFLAGSNTLQGNGGLFIEGGATASANLTLTSSANATKGNVVMNNHYQFTITPTAVGSGSQNGIVYTGAAHTGQTASVEVNDLLLNSSNALAFATGNIATQRTYYLRRRSYSFAGPSTITDAVTLEIEGPPDAGPDATFTRASVARFRGGFLSMIDTVSGDSGVRIGAVTTGERSTNYRVFVEQVATTTLGIATGASSMGLQISGGASINDIHQIGFGFIAGDAAGINPPCIIGGIVSNAAGNTTEDFFVATRTVTTNTAPTIRLRVTAAGVLQGNAGLTVQGGAAVHTLTLSGGAGAASTLALQTAASDLIGMYGVAAVIQHATTGQTAGFTAGVGSAVLNDSTFTGGVGATAYTIGDVVRALKNLGVMLV